MSKLPVLTPKKVLTVLMRTGFYIHHQTGSHAQLRHQLKPHLRVTIPCHSRFDLSPAILLFILKQSELTRDEFLKFV